MKRIALAASAVLWLAILLAACSCAALPGVPFDSQSSASLALEKPASAPPAAEKPAYTPPPPGNIYLYGEMHGQEAIINQEYELWYAYYHDAGMRHLFVELPYYTTAFLNLWMQADGDEILDGLYEEWDGVLTGAPLLKGFYQRIKRECPETVFHGYDVGSFFETTGERYLKYLEENPSEEFFDNERRRLTNRTIAQGAYYYGHADEAYREERMAENFIREFDKLRGEDAMAICGAAHADADAEISRTVPAWRKSCAPLMATTCPART